VSGQAKWRGVWTGGEEQKEPGVKIEAGRARDVKECHKKSGVGDENKKKGGEKRCIRMEWKGDVGDEGNGRE